MINVRGVKTLQSSRKRSHECIEFARIDSRQHSNDAWTPLLIAHGFLAAEFDVEAVPITAYFFQLLTFRSKNVDRLPVGFWYLVGKGKPHSIIQYPFGTEIAKRSPPTGRSEIGIT